MQRILTGIEPIAAIAGLLSASGSTIAGSCSHETCELGEPSGPATGSSATSYIYVRSRHRDPVWVACTQHDHGCRDSGSIKSSNVPPGASGAVLEALSQE